MNVGDLVTAAKIGSSRATGRLLSLIENGAERWPASRMLYLPFVIGCMSFEHPAIVRVSDDQTGVLRRMRVRPAKVRYE